LCWSHARRKFFELADIAANARRGKSALAISPIALEAVKRIDALFAIERTINSASAQERLRVRKEQSVPLLAALETWLREERARLSRSSSVIKPIEVGAELAIHLGSDRAMQMIEEIDWGSLRVADTAAHLKALALRKRWASRKAVRHLADALVWGGYPMPATAPAARVVARLLAEDMVVPDVRRDLVRFLWDVAEVTEEAEQGPVLADLRAPLHEAVQQSYQVVMRLLDDADADMRRTAARAAFAHVQLAVLADQRSVLARHLLAWASEPSKYRVCWVRLLGDLGDYTRDFLTDPQVRTRAALAPALAGSEIATEIIVAALSQTAEDGIFRRSRYNLHELVGAALARLDDLQRIAIPAIAIARRGCVSDGRANGGTWGPLLVAVFRPPYTEGAELTPFQREFLVALVENR
jgi:hypothetical protein